MKKIIVLFTCLILVGVSNAQIAPAGTIVVDRAGKGHFRTVQQAIDSVRAFNPAGAVTILIKKGFY